MELNHLITMNSHNNSTIEHKGTSENSEQISTSTTLSFEDEKVLVYVNDLEEKLNSN